MHAIFNLIIGLFVLLFVIEFRQALAWLFGGGIVLALLIAVLPQAVLVAAFFLLILGGGIYGIQKNHKAPPTQWPPEMLAKRPSAIGLTDRRAWGFQPPGAPHE